jgi:class 3 adenylate cyclase
MNHFRDELHRRLHESADALPKSLVLAEAQLDHPDFEHLELGESLQDYAAVMFLDIRGFTRLSMALDIAETSRIVNGVVTAAAASLMRYGAHINDFPGDGIMAVFSKRALGDDIEVHAAALNGVADLMTDMHATLRDELLQVGISDPVQIAIGAYSGDVRWQRVGLPDCSRVMVLGEVAPLAAKFATSRETDAWETMIGGPVASDVPARFKEEKPAFTRQYDGKTLARPRWLLDAESFWRAGGQARESTKDLVSEARGISGAATSSLLGTAAPATARKGSGSRRPDHGVG